MDKLKEIFKTKSDELKAEVRALLKEHGGTKVDEVTCLLYTSPSPRD